MPEIAAGAIISGLGVTSAFAAGAITVASYAVVGAAIGAVSSAVMDGDIGKGALYGAVGGAVMGGFSTALNGAATAAIETGAQSMVQGGATAGVQSAASGSGVWGASTATDWFGSSTLGGGTVAAETVKDTAAGGFWGTVGKMGAEGAVGGIKTAFEYDAKKALAKEAEKERLWKSAEAEKDRAAQLAIAETRAGGSGALKAAIANNKAAMERQNDQQAHEKEVWGLNRQAKKDDQKAFSESVVGYEQKVGQIDNFMAAPTWLSPRSPQAPAAPQPQQPAEPVQTGQAQYVGQPAQPQPAAQPQAQSQAATNVQPPSGAAPQILPQGVM